MYQNADSMPRGFNKKVFDPEATLRSSESAYDPLIRKQNELLEYHLEPKSWDIKSIACSNTFRCLVVVIVLPVSIILALFVFLQNNTSSGSCFVEESCSANETFYDPVTGFTYDTGWGSAISTDCCNICLPGTPTKVCFNTTEGSNCMEKQGVAGDYDYVMLDQMWLPQYCNALAQGHDPTLSHLPGTKCVASRNTDISNSLVIHGLWPNYYDGFPQCCMPASSSSFESESESETMEPLVPSEVVKWNPTWSELEAAWYDPTKTAAGSSGSDSNECNICYILNHEWMKHGTCYQQQSSSFHGGGGIGGSGSGGSGSGSGSGITAAAGGLTDPQGYFHAGIEINNALAEMNAIVRSYANQNIQTTTLSTLYNYHVNIMCDPQDPMATDTQGVFLEIETCWKVENTPNQADPTFQMMDCAPASGSKFSTPCPSTVFLKAYMGPDQASK